MRLHQRRTRRVLAIAGAAVLAATAAACSSGNGGSSGGKVTITEFDYYTGGANAAMNAYNAQFMKAHPNIVVKPTSVPHANLITKILQDASAGNMPNLMLIDNPNVAEVAATGQLVPLDTMPGFTTAGYTAGATSECTYQGKHYCYPIGANTIGLFYNKAMLAAAHLSPPTTWAQLQSDAKALTTSALRDRVRRHQRRAVHLAARAVLLVQRRIADQREHPRIPAGPAAVGEHGQGRVSVQVRPVLGPGPRPDPAVPAPQSRHDHRRPVDLPRAECRRLEIQPAVRHRPDPGPPGRPEGNHPARRRNHGHRRRRLHGPAEGRLAMDPGHAAAHHHDTCHFPDVLPADQARGRQPVPQRRPRIHRLRPGNPDRPPPHHRIRRQLPQSLSGHLDRHPGRHHRHRLSELRTTNSPRHHLWHQ